MHWLFFESVMKLVDSPMTMMLLAIPKSNRGTNHYYGQHEPSTDGHELAYRTVDSAGRAARDLMDDFYGRVRADWVAQTGCARRNKEKYLDQFYWDAVIGWKDPGALATSCARKDGTVDPRHQPVAL
jgi:hypothetical protein